MREEQLIRRALARAILAGGRGWLIVEELWVPRSNVRADVAAIGPELHAFEIKSSVDTLKRLPRQADAYGALFDRCTAVVATRHTERAVALLPMWWSVVEAEVDNGAARLTTIREGSTSPDVEAESLVRLLWRHEAHAALVGLGHVVDARASRSALWRALLEGTDLDALRRVVRDSLRRRSPADARIPTRRFRQLAHEAGQ